MSISKELKPYSLLVSLFFVYACTQNPVGDDEISSRNRTIKGEVRLSNNLHSENVYVWLDGFNLGTRTDEQGKFRLALPPTSAQDNFAGVTGAFNLYFFVANFNLQSTQVFIQNGLFVYSEGEINSSGELNQPKFLIQNLQIQTKVQPSSVSNSEIVVVEGKSNFILRVDVTLQTVKDSIVVFYPALVKDTFGPLLYRNVDSNEVTILGSTVATFVDSDLDTVDMVPGKRTMVVPLFPDDLLPGEYEIIPYLLIKNEEIPERLIGSLGEDVEELGPDYLSIPMIREGNERFFKVFQ